MSTALGKLRASLALLVAAGLLTGTLGTLPAEADTQVTATVGVNIRSAPSTSSRIVGGLYRGQKVTAVSTANGWTKIRFRGGSAYVASRYLTSRGSVVAPASTGGNRVTTTAVNLRRGPGLSYSIRRVVREGTSVRVTGSARGFLEVIVGSTRGWISAQYLSRSSGSGLTVIGTRVATANLLVRTRSGSDYRVVGEVRKGTRLSVTGTTQNGRAQIIYRGAVRWVTARYLSNTAANLPTAPGLPKVVGTRYATSDLNIWTAATGSGRVTEVMRGEALMITGRVQSGRAQVIYNNAVRWVTAKYLSRNPISPDSVPSSWASTERRLTAKTIRVHRAARAKFPQIKVVGGYRQASSGEHPLGRALDLMIPNYKSSSGRALGTALAEWARDNARDLDINYVVWRQRIWNVQRDRDGWRFMADRGGDSANHYNHVHISVFA